MNFIQKLRRFLSRLFGPGKKKAKKVSIAEAIEISEKESGKSDESLVESASMKFSEIKHLVSRLSNASETLERQKIALGSGNEGFRRMVITSQKNLVRQLKGLSQKLQPPQSITPKSVKEYSEAAFSHISGLMPYWKNIAFTKLLLKDEVKEIGDSLKELSEAIGSLNEKAFSSGHGLNGVLAAAREMNAKNAVLSSSEKKASDSKKASLESENAVSLLRREIGSKKGSPGSARLSEIISLREAILSKKADLVSRFNAPLAPLERILKRLEALSDSLSPKQKETLGLLLRAPDSAIIADPKGESMKQIFSKALSLVENGSISIKDSEKERRQETLRDLISKDFFSEFFWEMNKLQAELMQLEREEASISISSELKRLDSELASAESCLVEARKTMLSAESQLPSAKEAFVSAELGFALKFNSFFEGKYEAGLPEKPENETPEKEKPGKA